MNVDDVLARGSIIPVVVIDDPARAVGLGGALARGGIGTAEVTFRTAAAPAAIEALAAAGDVLVGAGTVINRAQAEQAIACGAQFIVSPGYSDAVVEVAQAAGVPVLPGVADATTIMRALDAGIDVVKLFPASVVGGPAAIKALAAPFPDLRFVPTGGVLESNLAEYLSIPAVAAVGGSWMVPRGDIDRGDFALIAAHSASAVAAAAAARPAN